MEFLDDVAKIKIERDGIVQDYDVLFTFTSTLNNNLYIGYTDNSVDANGKKNIYVSSYNKDLKNNNYSTITNVDEINMISDVLEKIDMEVQE